MKDKKGFGARIKAAREKQNITLEKAAELCEVSVSSWKQYERGERLPTLSNFINICIILDASPDFLLGSELDELYQNMDEQKRLKADISRLTHEDIMVIQAAIAKRLELNQKI